MTPKPGLALEGLREQLLVELSGLGATGLAHLRGIVSGTGAAAETAGTAGPGVLLDADLDPAEPGDDVEPDVLEAALAAAAPAWAGAAPAAEPPTPARLATLRRRFHDLGAVNPFAADEYEEVKARLDVLEAPADGPPVGHRRAPAS